MAQKTVFSNEDNEIVVFRNDKGSLSFSDTSAMQTQFWKAITIDWDDVPALIHEIQHVFDMGKGDR